MRLLIVTQVVDTTDPVLGFFHEWIKGVAARTESVMVICLKRGVFDLPANVTVVSLGKEDHVGRTTYIIRFLRYIVSFRKEYDKVFVHMNQEYIVLGGLIWKLLSKDIFFWRNHVYGNILTRFACLLSQTVFYTSPDSFTARYKKSMKMPVGIVVTDRETNLIRDELAYVVVSRISPIKQIDIIVRQFIKAIRLNPALSLKIYGGPLPGGEAYDREIRSLIEDQPHIKMMGPVEHAAVPRLYSASGFFINMTGKGSYDKTLLEALAYGSIPISNNPVISDIVGDPYCIHPHEDVSNKILLSAQTSLDQRNAVRVRGRAYVLEAHSLPVLIDTLMKKIS